MMASSGSEFSLNDTIEGKIGVARDARDEVQKKTFTKWINKYLAKINRSVDNLYEDLRDGHNLIALLEALSGISLPREKGRMRFHRLQNVQIALDFLKQRKLRLVNIRNDDITDGNPKLTLGLIWTIILHFQVEDINLDGGEDLSARQALLLWAQRNMEGYDGIRVTNFSSSWQDGKAFNVIIHRNRPELIDMNQVMDNNNNVSNLDQAFHIAEKEFGVTRLLDSEDVDVDHPDERSIITYVSSLYDTFPQVPPLPSKVTEEEWLFAWEEYHLLLVTLTQWIQEQIRIMRNRKDIDASESIPEITRLKDELERFKTEDVQQKEADLKSIHPKYQHIEELSEDSRKKYEPPPGHEPGTVVVAWTTLLDAISDREVWIDEKYEKLRFFNELLVKINVATSECRKNLELAVIGIKQIRDGDESSSLPRNVETNLATCDAILENARADAQILKDKNYPKVDTLEKTLEALQEKCDDLKSEYNLTRQLAKQRKFLDSDQYKYLQYCIQWVNEHQNSVELFAFGNDLPGIRNQQKEFASVSHEVNNFDTAVDKCRNENKSKIDPASPEFETYCSLLSVLEKKYALLKKSVSDRSKHFNELYSFVSEATDHLIWMQQREDMALSKNIALCQQPTFNDEAEVFDKDLKDREPSVAATLKKGEGLKEHPAFNVVQSYTTALTNQLSFLQTISSCLQHHGDDLSKQEEFDEACERVHERLENIRQQLLEIDSQVDVIEPSSDVDICDQLQNVDVLLQDYRKAVEELLEQSTTVPCIKERNIPLEDENVLPATSLCEYHGKNLQVVDGEECTLEDNRDINEWKIKTLSEQRGTAPALLFRIPPVSKCNVEQAKLEELAWRDLVKECHKTSVKWNFCQLFMRLQKNQKAILAWTVESYKMIPEDEKDDALKKVKEDVALLNKSSETLEWKKTEQHVSTCNITLELCNKHIQEIELKLNEEKETEEKCVSYTSELNVLLSNLKDVHKVVTIRIITPLPQQKQELKLVVNEHQETINDLCEQKPKYERLSSEVTAFVEDYSTHSSVQSLSSCLDIVVSQWKSTWNVTHLYLEKLKTACVLVDQIDVVEDMISEFESHISMTEQDSGSVTDVDGIMRHQTMLKNIKEAMDTKTPLVSEMTHCNLKLKDSIEPLDDCMENDQSTQTCLEDMNLYGLSSDGDAWTERVDTDIERWNACNKAVMSQLQYLTDMLPEAEKAAAEKLEAETLLAKLSDLLNKIKLLEEQQMSLASEKLPVDEESLANCLENQQNTVKEVESLKPAYDNLQTGVVNFVNNELTRPVECLPQLKEQLLEMQQTWISLWLVCHVQLERIKGFKCTHHEIDAMESTVKNYENNLDEIEAAILKHENDMMQLRVQAANIKNMKSGCDEVDKNFKIMKDNLKSVQSIVSQFSEPLLPCKELEDSNERLIALEERWNEVKKRLERMFEDIDNKLMNLERNAIVSKDAAEIMSALALLGQKVDAVEDSMVDEANSQLPLDVESIKQAEEKHDSFKPLLAEVEMSADDLQKKFDQIKETRTPEVENVEEQFSKFNDRCKFVAVLLDQRKPIYADLRDIIEHLNKDEATIDGFDKKIDEVDEKLKECGNNVDEVKNQVEKLKTLKDECDDVDSSLAELKSKIVATYQVVDGFDDKIKTCKELDACNAKADALDEKWGDVKKRLDRQLSQACDQLTQAERNVAASKDAAGISSELASLQDKVEAIEKAIEEEVNSQRPLDVQSIKNAEAQHNGLKSQLDDARSNADDLQKKFDQIKETKTPEVENVEEQFSKFNDRCKFVAVLLDQRKPIYADLRDIIEHLNKDEATIDGFDKKIDEVDEKLKECGNDVDEVKNQVEILKTLKDECDDVDSSLGEVKGKIVATYQVVDSFDDKIKTCKELGACNAKAVALDEKWGDVKKRLDRERSQACDQLTQAERNIAANKDAAGISSELASLQEKVEAIEKAIEKEVNSQRPLDVQSIKNAEAQHDGLKSQLDDARSNADDLQKKFDQIKETKTPEVENVEEQFSKFNDRCKCVAVLLDQRKPIYADLRDIIEHLNKDEATIDGFDKKIDEVDEKLKECGNDVDEVKNQVEILKILKDECDDVDSSLAELKGKIVATYQVVDGFDDKIKTCKELDACNAKADAQDEKWGDVKKRLDRELTEACDQLTQAERNVAASKDAAGISSELALLQDKVEAIEKAIEEEVNSQRPLDVQSIKNAEAQHDGLKFQLDDARSNADDLQKKFDQIKETKTPEVENVEEQFSKFNDRCKFVAVLLDQRKPIYADLRDIIEHLNKDEATIDGFDKKIDEVDEKLKECGNDVDEVKNQVEILKTLKDECDDVDSSLGEVKGKIAATYQVVDGFDDKIKTCKELDACNAKAVALDEKWGDVKKRLDRELSQARDQLTQAERNVAASKDAAGISSELASLQDKVEAIEKAIEEEVNSQLPLDVQSIKNAEAQHDCLKPQLDDARSNADDLKKRFENIKDTRTPEVEKLEQQFPQFIEHCDFVGILLDQRKDIYVDLRGIVEHINRDESALDDCAKELDTIDQKLEDCGNETDELKYQIEKLKDLKENYDYMDDSLDGLKNNMASTRQLLDDCDDKVKTCKELDACELRFLALEQKWKNLKDRLDRQITDACNQLEVAERNAAVSKNVHDLLSALEQYRNEVNSVEDSILEENNTKLPLDTESISNAKEQHDGLKAPLGKAKAGADDLHKKFEDLKENETSEITELGEKFADFFKHWKFVTTLYEQRQQIYVVLLHIEESYLNSKDLVNKFEKNLDDYSKDADTMEELQHQIEQYETLKTSCVDGDENFVKLKENIKSAEELFAHFDLKVQKCKEVEAYREKTSLLEERWDDLKKRLELKIMESSLKLAKAKKDSAARKDADDLVAALNKLAQDLDEIEEAIKEQSSAPVQTEPEFIQKVENKHEALEPKLSKTRSDGDDLHQKLDELNSDQEAADMPEVVEVEKQFESFDKKLNYVSTLYTERKKVIQLTKDTVDSMSVARNVIRTYATELLIHDIMADNQEDLTQQRDVLQKLDSEIPEHDPKFEELNEKSSSLDSCLHSFEEHGVTYDNTVPVACQDLAERWKDAKYQVKQRLSYVLVGKDKLTELQQAVQEENEKLQDKEILVNTQTPEGVEQDSKTLEDKIKKHEAVEAELLAQYPTVEHLNDLSEEFDAVARNYDKVAFEYDIPELEGLPDYVKPTLEELEERSSERKKIIQIEVITVTKRYDKLKNLISEKIEKYKVDYQIAKQREEDGSTKTTITTTTTTTKKRRNLHDIKFYTYLEKQTSAHDLHNAGIVSDEMAEQLELGILHEDKVEEEIKTFLTGTEPIAGLTIEKAGNLKLSINDAIKHGLIKHGTGLVLLEAQAATGNVIDPKTAEHMSVAEAVRRGIIDMKYRDALERAERAVTGFEDPVTHKILSLYECMKKGYIVESHGIRLLEAQIATGGLIDPRAYHRVPISVAYKRGLFDERMNAILEDPSDDTKGFFDPNTQKNLTYLDLVQKCKVDPETKLLFLEMDLSYDVANKLLKRLDRMDLIQKRSQVDITFNTAFHHEAKLKDIYEAGLVTEQQVKDLESGVLTESDLQGQLKQYLFGGEEPICGVVLEDSGDILSIVEAVNRSILRRGTAIELLEAQAATGNIIDPNTGLKMSVKTAFEKGLIERSQVDTLERAERAVKGYTVPGSKKVYSLFEAMRKGIVVESRGIRLLEAQIATGGLIDPRAHHRVPISVAYKRGLFDERMNAILEDPSDDTKGFFDPNTQKNLSYLELMENCEIKGTSNLRFLIMKPKSKRKHSSKDKSKSRTKEESKTKPEKTKTKSKKKEKSSAQSGPMKRENIKFSTVYQTEVTLEILVKYHIVTEEVAVMIEQGQMDKLELQKNIQKYLRGTTCIAGISRPRTGETLSFLEASIRGLISPALAMEYLEAQAYIGSIINPKTGDRMQVLDAYMSGLLKRNQMKDLQRAEQVVHGRLQSGQSVKSSLQDFMKNEFLTFTQVLRAIDCQIATGGIIDAKNMIRLPTDVAISHNIVSEEMIKNAADSKTFTHPFTNVKKSYSELMEECKLDANTGMYLIPCTTETSQPSKEVTEVDASGRIVKNRREIRFSTTLNRYTSLQQLLEAKIVTEETVVALEENRISEEEVAKSIKQYLVGEHPIAGIIVESTGLKLSILESIQQGIIKRGTGLELLEAQAANGSIIEPRSGQHFHIADAMKHHLLDRTQSDALERALKAVTGYRDPLSKATLSLFQAMEKGYVTQSRGIRLLEAQIATGGLIDPNSSHRVPLSLAFERNIINKKMFGILTDPSDDTKGFFDPNTNENLTYLELLSRCIADPNTGLIYLPLRDKKKSRHSSGSAKHKKKRKTQRSRKVVIIDPESGLELSIQDAYRKGLVDKATAKQLTEQEGEWTEESEIHKDRHDSQSSEEVIPSNTISPSYDSANGSATQNLFKQGKLSSEHLSAKLLLMSTGQYGPIAGVYDVKNGEYLTIKEAEQKRLIDRTSAQRLLEAQIATGGIINPKGKNAARCTTNEAIALGLLDRRVAQRLSMAEKAFKGFPDSRTNRLLSLGEAIKKGTCYYESGSRLLEFQYATGGLVNPVDGGRMTIEKALSNEWVDKKIADRLQDIQRYSKSIVDLKTNLLMTYPEALEKAVVEPVSGLRFLEALPRLDRNIKMSGGVVVQASSLYSSLTSSLASSRAESPVGSQSGSRRGSFDGIDSLIKSLPKY
ncbi:unnamed protein product [Clavelina lepadiformis]|uniref:Calponin-homology (CH) domain-containing protein n=1 Tax=Clavelina lepadiformis TaxID=159417 RepID=A0ABP0GJN7_CLALP